MNTNTTDPVVIGSPCNIEVLLHYHSSPEAHERWDAPAVQSCVEQLVRLGVLVPRIEKGYDCFTKFETTKLGRAWVAAICNTRLPRSVFLDDMGREIDYAH